MSPRRRCLAPNKHGNGLCQNYHGTCPIRAHRQTSGQPRISAPTVRVDWEHSRVDAKEAASLFNDSSLFRDVVTETARAYAMSPTKIEADYWLVRTLHSWFTAVGDDRIPRAYSDPKKSAASQSVGRMVFGGGTSLSAAWGITERWSQDIDMILAPIKETTPKQLRRACKSAAMSAAGQIDCTFKETSRGKDHYFLEFRKERREVSSVDIAFQPVDEPPLWTQKVPVVSMIGRVCGPNLLETYPELGGFKFSTLGPGTTAMNKLLAQTEMSESGDLDSIRGRARDVYDLACIAKNADDFEGHIGRDSKALLWVAESWTSDGVRARPNDGFASIKSFDPSTREHEALADGYAEVLKEMVWGTTLPLNEAIALAVNLDPGPPEPPLTIDDNPLIAYPP